MMTHSYDECGSCYRYTLLESILYRKREFYIDSLSSLLARIPFRHRLDYSQGFCIEGRVYAFGNDRIDDIAFFGNNESNNHSTLHPVFLSGLRILDILRQPLHTFAHTAWEFWLFFYYLEDLLFFNFFFFHFNRSIFHFYRLYQLSCSYKRNQKPSGCKSGNDFGGCLPLAYGRN